ncbi:hypothetical protein QQP08_002276 [Theobroma cacao]|nr:hypothetical protein QQP08_002276 [Theobroma cacao]
MLALMAVQRQTAASRSARPWMRGQQGVFGGVPTTSTLAHTPNLRVSLGQEAAAGGLVDGGKYDTRRPHVSRFDLR